MPRSDRAMYRRLLAGGALVAALCLGSGAVAWAASARPAPTAARPAAAKAAAPSRPQAAQAPADQDEVPKSRVGVACFTNACGGGQARASIPRDPVRVGAAIKAGDAGAALAAGGDGNDVLSAWASADQQGGANSAMIQRMQAGRVVVEGVDDTGEITVRSYLDNGRNLILRREPAGVMQGSGPGG